MDQIPADLILSEQSIRAGVSAMERIHGGHLRDMTPDEQEEARSHWRDQVEQVLASVRDVLTGGAPEDGGRAVLTFSDVGPEQIDVGIAFQPDLRDVGDGQVEGTPAQLLALAALEAIAEDQDEEV